MEKTKEISGSCKNSLDRDIPASTWNTYLKAYKDRYQLRRDEIGIWSIRLNKNLGFIQPYSIVKKQLHAILTFRSSQHKTWFLKKLDADMIVSQEGDTELCIVFNESNLQKYEDLLCIRKRKNLSIEQRQRLSSRMKNITV